MVEGILYDRSRKLLQGALVLRIPNKQLITGLASRFRAGTVLSETRTAIFVSTRKYRVRSGTWRSAANPQRVRPYP